MILMSLHEWIQSILYWLICAGGVLFVILGLIGLLTIYYLIFTQIIPGPIGRIKSKLSAATSHSAWEFLSWLKSSMLLAWLGVLGLAVLRWVHSAMFIDR
jgi:hypothetical protein